MQVTAAAKAGILSLCRTLGVSRFTRARLRDHLLVLCYHGVVEHRRTDRFGYGNTVSVEEFHDHLSFIAGHFHPVSAADVLAERSGGPRLPRGAALVTFDDGYRNNLTLAAPLLRAAGVPAVFFVATSYIGADKVLWTDDLIARVMNWPSDHKLKLPDGSYAEVPRELTARREFAQSLRNRCKRLEWTAVQTWLKELTELSSKPESDAESQSFMNWDEVRELHSLGFEIGSHTATHPILTRISPEALAQELGSSKQKIEHELGVPCRLIAYPNGGAADVSNEVFSAARNAGYELGFTVSERHSPPGEEPLSISRLCIQGHLNIEDFEYRVDGLQRLLHAGSAG